jgi:drug/metabolite transporter (DMT)-like permease
MLSSKSYTAFGMAALVFWATTSALTIDIVGRIGPLTAIAVLSLGGGVILLLAEIWRHESLRAIFGADPKYLLFGSLFFAGYDVFFFIAFSLSPSESVSLQLNLVNYLWPIFVVFLSLLLFKPRIRAVFLYPGALVGFLGIAVTLSGGTLLLSMAETLKSSWLPCVMMLFAAASWGLFSNIAKKYHKPKDPSGIPLFLLILGMCALVARFALHEHSHWDWSLAPLIIYVTVFPTTLSNLLWEQGMRGGNVTLIGSASYFAPFLSTVFACFYLNLPLGVNLILGGALIVAGAFMTKRGIQES